MRTIDSTLDEGFEVPELWKRTFLAKRRVMTIVICRLIDKERRVKG
jgi:hypothetical protein